jgi:alpha-N-arabinofuranosidase
MTQKIVVNTKDIRSKIDRNIYGQFSEHLGNCIYGGFWVGKKSSIPNIDGCNKAVVEAFKKIKIPQLRWPGGCFADEYHWKDGIGPQEKRRRMVNSNWGNVVEDNSFGTHEFMELCELLSCDDHVCEPYICGNVGSGTVQEMAEWIEYLTCSGDSTFAEMRRVNGHKDAWKLHYFGVGNENWGGGGNMTAQFYSDNYKRYQTYVRQYGDKINKIACGPSNDDYNWTDTLMKNAAFCLDGISLHYYTITNDWNHKGSATEFDENEWMKTMKATLHMETLLNHHSEVMDKYDHDKRVMLVVDEWGNWFDVEPGTNPGFLYQQNTVRDALVAGINLNMFNNHCDRVRMANIAQAVNVLQSPVLAKGDKIVLTPTYHVFDLFKDHMDATLVGTSCSCETFTHGDITIPSLNVSASVKDKVYTVTVTNANPESSAPIEMELAGMEGRIDSVEVRTITGGKMNACNTFEKPDEVTIERLSCSCEGNSKIYCTLPAMSVSKLSIFVK